MTVLDLAGRADALAAVAVSRETQDRLDLYAELLLKWQPKINLVGPDTVPELWRRHFLDSMQLLPLLPAATQRLVDLGSGAGFPGLVLAMLGVPEVHLVESDARKAIFLREVARQAGVAVTVHNMRIEAMTPLPADVVTARALAPLPRLLDWAERFRQPHTVLLFLKGRGAEAELAQAGLAASPAVTRHPSRTDPDATVLRIGA